MGSLRWLIAASRLNGRGRRAIFSMAAISASEFVRRS
jgi:hypothetical protein